jgi:hypothetical protein
MESDSGEVATAGAGESTGAVTDGAIPFADGTEGTGLGSCSGVRGFGRDGVAPESTDDGSADAGGEPARVAASTGFGGNGADFCGVSAVRGTEVVGTDGLGVAW